MPHFRPLPGHPPEPPVPLPEGRILHVRGRGEYFVRDSGGDGPPVLLLHGWMFPADTNWWPVYDALAQRGMRVLAMDLRGHGRGLRTREPFRLADCAADAAAVLETLGCGPAVVVGYSMGGPVAALMARDFPEKVRAHVHCATAQDWHGRRMRTIWRTMGALQLGLGVFPLGAWEAMLRAWSLPPDAHREWVAAELSRGSSLDIAEAGRELGRYDAKPWIGRVNAGPSAVVVTAQDRSVPPGKQRALAAALGATTVEVQADHLAVVTHRAEFRAALLEALDAVGADARSRPVA